MLKFLIPTKSTYFSSDIITHSQMMDEMFEYSMKCVTIIGVDIFNHNYSIYNKKFVFVFTLMMLSYVINIYDIFLFQEDMVRCVFCLLVFSCLVQAFVKIYTFVWMRHNILNLKEQSCKFQEHFSTLKSSKIFEEKIMIAAHVIAGLTLLYICTFILLTLYPFIFYFIMNKKILLCGIELPFIEWEDSWIGFGINFTHQLMCLFIFFCGSVFCLCVIIILITSGVCQFDVLEILLDELNELIIENVNGSNNHKIRQKIKFLVKTHTNLIAFLHDLRASFMVYYFVELGALVFQKTIELFAISTINFIPGYLCALVTGFQLFLPCAFGSILVSKGEKYYHDLYNISWHLMSNSDQKLLRFIIFYSKRSKSLAAGIRILELSAFLEVKFTFL
ncbi:uncharacterized protein [Chironomus tepperi]|uniref:uncharacterized protein n=1 Tax=Chironomus tepperi TaxID=113505 RepID=UPI00391F56F7